MSVPTSRSPSRRDIVVSAGGLVALLVLAPAVLLAVSQARFASWSPLAGVRGPSSWSFSSIADSLSAPVRDDTVVELLVRVSLVLAWMAIVVIVVNVVLEAVHLVRHDGIPRPHVRGLGWSQPLARMIAGGLLAVVPLSTSSPSVPAMMHATSALADGPESPPSDGTEYQPDTVGHREVGVEAAASERLSVHVVVRGESVYGIAQQLAEGDDRLTIEIAEAILDANLGGRMVDGGRFTNPALIQPGWELVIPADVSDVVVAEASTSEPDRLDRDVDPGGSDRIVVEAGDTLSALAERHLDDRRRWTEIWELNRGRPMGDGRVFDDPDLIVVGWTLRLPSSPGSLPAPDPAIAAEPPTASPPRPTGDAPSPQPPTTGPVTSAPATTGPVTTGPVTSAPATTGPVTSGPVTSAPATTGPVPTTAESTVTRPATAAPPSTTAVVPSTTGTSVVAGDVPGSDRGVGMQPDDVTASLPVSPVRIEHAAFLAGGLVALLGVRRRRRMRSAVRGARIPAPLERDVDVERGLRVLDPGESSARVDIALRSAAVLLRDSDASIGLVVSARDGTVSLNLTGDAEPTSPWVGGRRVWTLPASVPIEALAEAARGVGAPCLAVVQIGLDAEGNDVLVDLEAAGSLVVHAGERDADDIVRAIAMGLASSSYAESVHLVVVSMGTEHLLDHPGVHTATDATSALELARSLAGTTVANPRRSFDLRSRGTGGEMWEPAVVLLLGADVEDEAVPTPRPGHGLAVVASTGRAPDGRSRVRIERDHTSWTLTGFDSTWAITPVGISEGDAEAVVGLLGRADEALEDDASRPSGEPAAPDGAVDPTRSGGAVEAAHASASGERSHEIVVSLIGPVEVRAAGRDPDGAVASFQRSKTVELIAWLATHRERSTRTAARTALWEIDVRDATFANVVSEARRGLARLVEPPDGREWIARTLTEELPLHDHVVTDAELIEDRLALARRLPPGEAIDVLRPALATIRGMPFEGTSYLWPDAEGLTSNLVLLATTAAGELAGHALEVGDTDLVFWATGQGLRVLPGHEELIALRMRAHAGAGDLAGVRQEWESYERVIVADPWSDGEPAPKLLALRQELLSGSA